VGREEELEMIYKELQYNETRKTVVLHGLGGMGKTLLALTFAQRYRDTYSAVFWMNSKNVDTLKQGYVAAAKRIFREYPSLGHLKTIAEGDNLDEAVEAVKQWLSSAHNDRWLIIYDNHDTPKLPGNHDAGAFDIRPFFPDVSHGAILITTRSSQLRLGRTIAVKKLPNVKQGLEILADMSERDGLNSGRW
jgi:hypothetical protein